MKLKVILGIILLLAISMAGCTAQQGPQQGSGVSSEMPVPGSEDVDEMIVSPAEPGQEGGSETGSSAGAEAGRGTADSENRAKEITMTARQWEFEPDTIRVKQGDRVRLEITSIDVKHGFAIEAYDINEQLLPGQMTVVEFVADKKGTFRFYCSVVCGAGHSGMDGTLIVE